MWKYSLLFLISFSVFANNNFETWKTELIKSEKNIQKKELLNKISFLPKVIELDRRQPEKTLPFSVYFNRMITPQRLEQATSIYQQNLPILLKASEKFGIDTSYFIAFWGMETNFGQNKGNIQSLSALATLSYDGRRKDFFKQQLDEMLNIIINEDIDIPFSSWAGAFGHFQFMPTTFTGYKMNGDDKLPIDIVNSFEDAVFSAGNYLQKMGWKRGKKWGKKIVLPANFNMNNIDVNLSANELQKAGIDIDKGIDKARIILPMGIKGPAFLVYHNFDVIKKWNNSDYYALIIGIMSDKIKNRDEININNYFMEKRFTTDEIKKIQTSLNAKGFYSDTIDGVLGKKTKQAIKGYQQQSNLVADGYLSENLYNLIISG